MDVDMKLLAVIFLRGEKLFTVLFIFQRFCLELIQSAGSNKSYFVI